jgi:thioredoxin 1
VLEINAENFEAEVLKSDKPVLLDFWGTKCEPCKALMPAVEKLAEKYGDKIKFCKLNTAENRRLAISQKVLGLPTIAMYKDGAKVEELTQDKATPDNIEEMLKRYV